MGNVDVGQTVALAGIMGPKMVVTRLPHQSEDLNSKYGQVECTWFTSANELQQAWFLTTVLEPWVLQGLSVEMPPHQKAPPEVK